MSGSSPEVGSLAADLILLRALRVTQVKCEVVRTPHVYQTLAICGGKGLKKWIQNKVTCDDCVVVVAVPSIGAGISFVRVVITFQIGITRLENIPKEQAVGNQMFMILTITFHHCLESRFR